MNLEPYQWLCPACGSYPPYRGPPTDVRHYPPGPWACPAPLEKETAGPWGFRTNRSHPPDQPGASPNGSGASTACSGIPRPNRGLPRTVRGCLRLVRGFNGPIGAVPGRTGGVPRRFGDVYGLPVDGKGRLGGFNGRFGGVSGRTGGVPRRTGGVYGLIVGGYKTVTPASATSKATPSKRSRATWLGYPARAPP